MRISFVRAAAAEPASRPTMLTTENLAHVGGVQLRDASPQGSWQLARRAASAPSGIAAVECELLPVSAQARLHSVSPLGASQHAGNVDCFVGPSESWRPYQVCKVTWPLPALKCPWGTLLLSDTLRRGTHAKFKLALDVDTGEVCAVRVVRREYKSGTTPSGRPATVPLSFKNICAETQIMREVNSWVAPRAIVAIDSYDRSKPGYFGLLHPLMRMDLEVAIKQLRQLQPLLQALVARDVLCQLSGDLAALHQRGYVHRDLKPDNVLIGEGRIYLADYGLAASQQNWCLPRGPCGFSAPEAFWRLHPHSSSDVWSLGLVYAAMLHDVPFPRRLAGHLWKHLLFVRWYRCYEAWHESGKPGPLRTRYPAFDNFYNRLASHDPAMVSLLFSLLHPDASKRPTAQQLHQLLSVGQLALSGGEKQAVDQAWSQVASPPAQTSALRQLESYRSLWQVVGNEAAALKR